MRAILDVFGLREVVEHSSRHIRGTARQVVRRENPKGRIYTWMWNSEQVEGNPRRVANIISTYKFFT